MAGLPFGRIQLNRFSQFLTGTQEGYGDPGLGNAESLGKFFVRKAFDMPQQKKLGPGWVDLPQRIPQPRGQFLTGMLSGGIREVFQRWASMLARAQNVEGRIYRRSPQIVFRLINPAERSIAAKKTQKDGLQCIFRVGTVAQNAECGLENRMAVFPVNALEVGRNHKARI
jgi:hypothetical protein